MIWCPGPEAVIGVEIHGVDVLLPLDLLQSHGGLVGGEDGGGETEAPVNGQPANGNVSHHIQTKRCSDIFLFALILLISQMCS